MTGLSLKLLGPFDARRDGEPLPPLRSRKGQWLLALLALRHGREVRREWLAETLWPDSLPDEAYASLRQSLADLRRALGPEAERITAPSVRTLRLDLPAEAVDVAPFDQAVRHGDPESLRRAVSLYRGPLLEGWSEPWVLPEREARAQAYGKALRALADAALASGDRAEAVRCLRVGAAADPFAQETHRALMRLLARDGEYQTAFETYHELRRRLFNEFHAEPEAETTALYRSIQDRARQQRRAVQPPAPSLSAVGPTPRAVPNPLSPLVGRQREVGEIGARLLSARLVTLVGPGGVGKTRLATEVALESAGEYAHGAFFVDLGSVAEPGRVPAAMAAALGISEEGGRPAEETLLDLLRPRQVLLVLDNCEHLLAACARLAERLLRECGGLRILATSRERLGITGEAAWRVPPMEEAEALRLFEERAAAVRAGFQVTEANADAAARTCRRLDGIPLAIELAAALAESLSIDEIAAGLDHRFDLLTGGDRTRPRRQQTLRAMIDWSYDLLSEGERVLLRRLSVFSGGCLLRDIEQVADFGSPGSRPGETRSRLSALVSKSLVVAEEAGGKTRYRLLETVREYAAERLAEAGEMEKARERHLDIYLRLAEEAAPALTGPEQSAWLARLDAEYENLRAALSAACMGVWVYGCVGDRTGDPSARKSIHAPTRLTAALGRYWQIRGYYSEGREWLERALAAGEETGVTPEHADPHTHTPTHPHTRTPTHARAAALAWAGFLAIFQGEYETARRRCDESVASWRELGDARGLSAALGSLALLRKDSGDLEVARSLFEESLALARQAGDFSGTAAALGYLGILAKDRGDAAEARRLYEESLALRRQAGDRWGIAASLNNLGLLELALSRPAEARTHLEESLRIRRELADRRCIGVSLNCLGQIALTEGDLERARQCLEESLRIAWELGEKRGMAYSLEAFARLDAARGRWERAARLAGAAAALRARIGSPLTRSDAERFEGLRQEAVCALGESDYQASRAAGEALPFEDAVGLALERDSPS